MLGNKGIGSGRRPWRAFYITSDECCHREGTSPVNNVRSNRQIRYSSRSATTGSTLVVRHAGITVAVNATATNSTGTTPNVAASVVLTANSKLAITRVNANAPTSPTRIPITANSIPCRSTSPRTSPGRAPNAISTPMSWVFCVTRYDITPYSPTAASNIANAANAASMVLEKRWRASESYHRSCMVRFS
jgi:hypothetical protein